MSVRDFLTAVDFAQRELPPHQQQLGSLRQAVGQWNGEIGEIRREDVAEQAVATERTFNRARV